MNKHSPLVTVITPVFNGSRFLHGYFNSVLSQIGIPFEVLLIDDASSDNSADLIKSYEKKYPYIKSICLKKNVGALECRNIGIKHVRTEFLAFLDVDDLWPPEKLFVQLEFMRSRNVDISFTDYKILYNGMSSFSLKAPFYQLNLNWLLSTRYIACSSLIVNFKKNKDLVFRKIDGVKRAEDLVFLFDSLKKEKIILRCPHVLLTYRIVDHSRSRGQHFLKSVWLIYRSNLKPLAHYFYFLLYLFFSIFKKLIFNPYFKKDSYICERPLIISNQGLGNHFIKPDFTVLMSVYYKSNLFEFKQAINSIFSNSLLPNKFILVIDGSVRSNMTKYITFLKKKHKLEIIVLDKNLGLSAALNEGLKYVETEWVVRADSDDICLPYRFEYQTAMMSKNLDLIGGSIEEVNDDSIVTFRVPPVTAVEIKKFAKYRNPFNHMTVAFRTEFAINCGGYPNIPYKEDYALWAKMISKGARVLNSSIALVKVSAGRDMILRRKNIDSIVSEYELRKILFRNINNNYFMSYFILLFRAGLLMCSLGILISLYRNLLRSTYRVK